MPIFLDLYLEPKAELTCLQRTAPGPTGPGAVLSYVLIACWGLPHKERYGLTAPQFPGAGPG